MTVLENIVRALSNPQTYPELTAKVELAQTQMSLVFLTDKFVYKIKKPVNLGYLDYSTLELRKFYCEQEVKLNQRLCKDIYLRVNIITSDGKNITINGKGKTIEYAVKMCKLPQDRMMDVLLVKNQVTSDMIERVAEKVAEFHRQTQTSPEIGKFGSIATITINTEENFSQTAGYIGRVVQQAQFDRIGNYTSDFMINNSALFNKRVTQGKIKDCHGDFHAQHICFTNDGICIYDCIEFNDRFRYVDVAAEVSFLAMDLDHWGHAELSTQFVTAYVEKSGDIDLPKLLNFYKCYFAYVRAKVNCFKLEAPLVSDPDKEKAMTDAKKYFNLAVSYIK